MSPVVWLLMGAKAGDNNQVMALAEALGWEYRILRFKHRATELFTNRLLGVTLAGIYQKKSDVIRPPWPDLLISAGRRNEPVARWIKHQSANKTKIIHLGRPWAKLDNFDLIVTTSQYHLPQRPNILHLDSVLHRITKQRLEQESAQWEAEIAVLNAPYIAVLVGGDSGAYHFDVNAARKLAIAIDTLAEQMSASVLVTTSARTEQQAGKVLEQAIQAPNYFYQWTVDQQRNPYYAYLAIADAFVVTGESVSMVTEACVMGKPVYLYDFGLGQDSMRDGGDSGRGLLSVLGLHAGKARWRILLHKLAMRFGSSRMQRNIRAIHRYYIETGQAVWLGESFPVKDRLAENNDIERAVNRVKQMMDLSSDE